MGLNDGDNVLGIVFIYSKPPHNTDDSILRAYNILVIFYMFFLGCAFVLEVSRDVVM